MSEMKAVVTGTPSPVQKKENGGSYVLIDCKITSGPAKDADVPGILTVKNRNGKERDPNTFSIGDEVTLYHEALPSTKEPGKFVHFFEMSAGITPKTSNDKLTELLGSSVEEEQKLG